MEIYKRFRPKKLEDVVGQSNAVSTLKTFFARNEVPQCILLMGPSGTGKTTLGRIIRRMLGCSKMDYHEKDCTTEEKPLDYVRELKRSTSLMPMQGKVSVWFLEEFQSLSRAGFSQQALLKTIEDAPAHTYFILATTDELKILKAIRSRATEIRLGAIKEPDMRKLLTGVIASEKMSIGEDVLDAIIEGAEGGARKALVILGQVASLTDEKEQLKAAEKASYAKDEAITLARLLLNPKGWPSIATVLKNLAEDDPEGIRYCVLAYCRSCMLGGESKPPNMNIAPRAFRIIDIFSKNFYDSKHAGLAAACWEVVCME